MGDDEGWMAQQVGRMLDLTRYLLSYIDRACGRLDERRLVREGEDQPKVSATFRYVEPEFQLRAYDMKSLRKPKVTAICEVETFGAILMRDGICNKLHELITGRKEGSEEANGVWKREDLERGRFGWTQTLSSYVLDVSPFSSLLGCLRVAHLSS